VISYRQADLLKQFKQQQKYGQDYTLRIIRQYDDADNEWWRLTEPSDEAPEEIWSRLREAIDECGFEQNSHFGLCKLIERPMYIDETYNRLLSVMPTFNLHPVIGGSSLGPREDPSEIVIKYRAKP
jgi:hypothetical protein